jgi:hypothetical protein
MVADTAKPLPPDPVGGERTDVAHAAGGLDAGIARTRGKVPSAHDAPGVAPDGRRIGASSPFEPPDVEAHLPPAAEGPPTAVVGAADHPLGHLEPDEAQLVRARFTSKPAAALPPQDLASGRGRPDQPPIEDVVVSEVEASVWEALPLSARNPQ